MKYNLKISVIVPIYNVERYLSQCIESILKQNYKNIEILLIDDGSTDQSGRICDQYSEKNVNIKVIHKENGGLSDARNVGILHSTGDYLMFLDGDDFWDNPTATAHLVKRLSITQADVLNYSFKKYYEDTEEKKPYFNNIKSMPLNFTSKDQQLNYLTKYHLYISSACCKVIRRELFTQALMFERNVYSEDVEWSARLLKASKSMDFICENFYCYRQRRDSISHTINEKKSHDLCKHTINCIKLFKHSEGCEKQALANYSAYQFGTYFIIQAQTDQPQNDCINRLEHYKNILRYHENNKKLIVLYMGCKIVGYKKLCKIIRSLYKIKHK